MIARSPWIGLVAAVIATAVVAVASPSVAPALRLFADTDDDDGDGIVDRDEPPSENAGDVERLEAPGGTLEVESVNGDSVRVVSGRRVLGARGRAARMAIQGVRAGMARVVLADRTLDVAVCDAQALDSSGAPLNLAVSHASLSRTLPAALSVAGEATDRDALVWRLVCPKSYLPTSVRFVSIRPNGEPLDAIESVSLSSEPCPGARDDRWECGRTQPIRATADLVDRQHPAISGRSLRAEVGGRIVVEAEGRKAASIRVGGPRETSLGPVERYRGRLRFHVVRTGSSGQAAVGIKDSVARSVARDEARTASMLWGQCGIHFGADDQVMVDVVDPPPRFLIAIGCDVGLPASGGVISFVVDSVPIHVPTRSGDSPVATAHAVAAAANAAGLSATVSTNARILPGALRTADVLVRRTNGELADVRSIPSVPLSSDSTLGVCLGDVNLGDGLSHFEDVDAAAGTVEERTLVRAYQDDDPSTIEVFIVPSFSKTGRIGESFIDADGTGIQNAVIVDRAAIRSGARSYALAHEIGHVLLDMPGHPDDFGVDRPWVLMDADAADPTIFGPRRLSVDDCERALVQSGPGSAVPLLEPWPLYKTRAKELPGLRK